MKEQPKRLKTIIILLMLAMVTGVAQAKPRHRNRNYILRRQEAYQVQGVPTDRLIIARREIDIYPNGQMFEGDHIVGVKPSSR